MKDSPIKVGYIKVPLEKLFWFDKTKFDER
jgi:hypothetical protein